MINKSYNYPWIGLWKGEGYPDTGRGCLPLVEPICKYLNEIDYLEGRPEEEQRREGELSRQGNCYIYPEIREYFESVQYRFTIWRQNVHTFLCFIPYEHDLRGGYKQDIDTMLTFAACSYKDPDYAMYALDYHKKYIDGLIEGRHAGIMVLCDKPRSVAQYVGVWSRMTAEYRLNYKRFWLDVSILINQGKILKDLPGFNYPLGDPDEMVTYFEAIPYLNVTGMWTRTTPPCDGIGGTGVGDSEFDLDRFIYSESGYKVAQESALNAMFTDALDPALMKHFDDMGVRCDHHEIKGEDWFAFVPKDALKDGFSEKLPVMCILGETGLFNSPGVISIFATFYEYIRLAAQGQMITVMFALEDADSNDLFVDIIHETAKLYPGDLERVYMTGHSHNCQFTQEFARRHQNLLAGIGPVSGTPGLDVNPRGCMDYGELMRTCSLEDMPFIMVAGVNEIYEMFPIHSVPSKQTNETIKSDLMGAELEKRMQTWRDRLQAWNCPDKSYEEIRATKYSPDIVERKLGIPADKTDVLFLDGFENYIADIKNKEGKWHLRIVGQENCPHCVQPSKATLCWSFLRRFKRDLETGKIVELY